MGRTIGPVLLKNVMTPNALFNPGVDDEPLRESSSDEEEMIDDLEADEDLSSSDTDEDEDEATGDGTLGTEGTFEDK